MIFCYDVNFFLYIGDLDIGIRNKVRYKSQIIIYQASFVQYYAKISFLFTLQLFLSLQGYQDEFGFNVSQRKVNISSFYSIFGTLNKEQ